MLLNIIICMHIDINIILNNNYIKIKSKHNLNRNKVLNLLFIFILKLNKKCLKQKPKLVSLFYNSNNCFITNSLIKYSLNLSWQSKTCYSKSTSWRFYENKHTSWFSKCSTTIGYNVRSKRNKYS